MPARSWRDSPPHLHAILATRRDLPLRLHQLRLAGELAELRAADLRFSLGETRELLAASGVTLSEAGVRLLHERTEGWAAGLRLAAISLAGHTDPDHFVTEFSGSSRTVAEYLIAEMLEGQPAEVQQLLLRTSLLDRFSGELADLLTGRPGSERILLGLEDANAFVVSLDPERTWFRYHHLFADLLRLELRRRLPEDVPALHRLAAQWLIQHGQVAEQHGGGTEPIVVPGLVNLAGTLIWTGELDEVDGLLQRAARALETDSGPGIRLLLHLATGLLYAVRSRYHEALAELLADILDFLHGSSVRPSGPSPVPPAEQLSPSELRVLGYLPTNLSRPEIAGELSVSVNTVNTHVRSIYAKLQAQDRSSAVQRARELRLLSRGSTR
jgi:LuxR family maltose regulon positive regulatory protein